MGQPGQQTWLSPNVSILSGQTFFGSLGPPEVADKVLSVSDGLFEDIGEDSSGGDIAVMEMIVQTCRRCGAIE